MNWDDNLNLFWLVKVGYFVVWVFYCVSVFVIKDIGFNDFFVFKFLIFWYLFGICKKNNYGKKVKYFMLCVLKWFLLNIKFYVNV